MADKKDVNVNTLFPSNLLDKLDDWAWRNRMTRSAALRTLVEMAFNQDKRVQVAGSSDAPSSQEATEEAQALLKQAYSLHQENLKLHEQLENALNEVIRANTQQNAMSVQIMQHSKAIDEIKDRITELTEKVEA